MSQPVECFPACPPSTPVQVPGPTGVNGINAFSTTTSPISLNMPAGTPVNITVVNGQWVALGEVLFISDQTNIGHFLVIAAPQFPYTTIQAAYYPQTTDTIGGVGVNIAAGAVVTPGAYNGADGYTFLSGPLTIPGLPSPTVVFSVYSNRGIGKGMVLLLTDGTNFAHFLVNAVTGTQTVNATLVYGYNDTPSGNTINAGALVGPSGEDGFSSFTFLTGNLKLPSSAGKLAIAADTTNNIPVFSSVMFAIGQPVFVSDGTNKGNFTVFAIPTSTSIQLTWLDSAGDSVAGDTIISGGISSSSVTNAAKVVPMGNPAPSAAAIWSDPSGGEASPPLGYVVTGVTASANMGQSGGYTISGGTLQNVGDSIEFEAWFKFLATGGTKTIVVNWAGNAIFTSAALGSANGTILKVSGRIVMTATGPNLQNCLVTSTLGGSYPTSSNAGASADPSLPQQIQILLTQTYLTDSLVLLYFMAKLLPG
jgi:hypothetical protein